MLPRSVRLGIQLRLLRRRRAWRSQAIQRARLASHGGTRRGRPDPRRLRGLPRRRPRPPAARRIRRCHPRIFRPG